MAVFVNSPGVVQCNLNFTWRNVPVLNTLYFSKVAAGAVTAADLLGLSVNVRDWWLNTLRAWITSEITFQSVYATDLTTQTSGTFLQTALLPVAGSQNTESVPNSIALCVKFGTGARGRGSRGRNYVPGMPQVQFADNYFNPGYTTNIIASYNAMDDWVDPAEWLHVVLSRYINKLPRPLGVATPVTSYSLTTQLGATQRGRRT